MPDNQIGERLRKLIKEHYKMSAHAFSQRYNDNGGVKTSQVIRGRNGLSSKLLGEITTAYPEINPGWLLTGQGNMLFENSQNSHHTMVSEDFGSVIAFSNTDNLNTNPNSEMGMNGGILKQLCDSITMKDQQINRLLSILENKDQQLNRAFTLLERGTGGLNVEPQKKEPNL